jgi:GAF domain-containing protein
LISLVAPAVQSRRLFEQAQTRSEELDILNEMGRTLTSLQDEQAIYETIYEYTGKLMDVSSFHIALYHKEEQEYSLPIMTERGERMQMPNQPAGNGLTDYIIKTRQPLLFKSNVDAEARALGIDPIIVGEDLPTLSWLGVPLIFQDRIIGVVGVQSDTIAGLYTEHERDLLVSIASQAAIALENASAFQQTQRQAEREAMINLISQRIQSTTSVEGALQVAIRELGRALGAKRTNVQLGLSHKQKQT